MVSEVQMVGSSLSDARETTSAIELCNGVGPLNKVSTDESP